MYTKEPKNPKVVQEYKNHQSRPTKCLSSPQTLTMITIRSQYTFLPTPINDSRKNSQLFDPHFHSYRKFSYFSPSIWSSEKDVNTIVKSVTTLPMKAIAQVFQDFTKYTHLVVGDKARICFWEDLWWGNQPLGSTITRSIQNYHN